MSEKAQSYTSTEINALFATLNPLDVEQFYSSYQLWTAQQKIIELQARISSLQQQKAANHERMQQVLPSALTLAALARLQSSGVNDADLLDRMLERGETWLDQTMQRLTYCEQLDFISNNYTEWCEHALDGAYDWIDSLYDNNTSADITQPTVTIPISNTDALDAATEELLLQKLMSDDAENEAFLQATTLKRPAVTFVQTPSEEAQPFLDEPSVVEPTEAVSDATSLHNLHASTESAEIAQPQDKPTTEDTEVHGLPATSDEPTATDVQPQSISATPSETTPQVDTSNDVLTSATSEQPSSEPVPEDDDFLPPTYRPRRKLGLLSRLLDIIFPPKK